MSIDIPASPHLASREVGVHRSAASPRLGEAEVLSVEVPAFLSEIERKAPGGCPLTTWIRQWCLSPEVPRQGAGRTISKPR